MSGYSRYRTAVIVIGALFLSLILVDFFTNLSSKTGQFIWFVVLPVVIVGLSWGDLFFLRN